MTRADVGKELAQLAARKTRVVRRAAKRREQARTISQQRAASAWLKSMAIRRFG